jgi:hypothetical protein
MKIELNIEWLILDGLPLEKRHAPMVRAAVERELTRLLTLHGLDHEWSGGAVPKVRASSIRLTKETHPNRLGRQIAQAVFSGLGGKR